MTAEIVGQEQRGLPVRKYYRARVARYKRAEDEIGAHGYVAVQSDARFAADHRRWVANMQNQGDGSRDSMTGIAPEGYAPMVVDASFASRNRRRI